MLTAGLVKEGAKAIGFNLVGITSAEPMLELEPILRARQKEGKESPFVTSNIKKRIDPKQYFPEGESILMVGLNYYYPLSSNQTCCKFARYTWGEDYHRVIGEKLEQLGVKLKQIEPKLEYKIFVDTGPLVERELARRAGLGFIGKNGTLINPDFGSWIFLGGMVLNLDLEEDSSLIGDCGNCKLCLKSCPPKAIEKPYQINPHLCLSYITQKKGHLTEEECKQINNRIYGCDTCQEVCPINRKAAKTAKEERLKGKKHVFLTPKEIIKLSKKELESYFGNTAAFWQGSNLIKRNALAVLSNSKGAETLPLLIDCLSAPSPLVRGQTALALGSYQDKKALKALKNALQKENDSQVYLLIQSALEKLKG